MWEHPITAEHMKKLKMSLMCKVSSIKLSTDQSTESLQEIPPIEKELICGDKGYGAMASLPMIASIVYSAVREKFAFRSQS